MPSIWWNLKRKISFKKILKWDWVIFNFHFQAITVGDNHLNSRGKNTIVGPTALHLTV